MSSTQYEYETVEIEESALEKEGKAQGLKPVAVKKGRVRPGDHVTGRVMEVLDFELAQGSMPT